MTRLNPLQKCVSTSEKDVMALTARLVSDGLREMAFTHTARADKKHILLSLYKLHGSDLPNHQFIDFLVKREIEILQCLLRVQIAAR